MQFQYKNITQVNLLIFQISNIPFQTLNCVPILELKGCSWIINFTNYDNEYGLFVSINLK